MKNIFRTTLALALMFGVSLSYGQANNEISEEKIEQAQAEFEKLKKELELTDDQAEQLKALFKERNKTLKAERPPEDQMSAMSEDQKKQLKMHQMKLRKQLTDEMNTQVAEILNEEQLVKYNKISEEKMLEAKERHQNQKMKGQHDDNPMDQGDVHQHEDGTEHKH